MASSTVVRPYDLERSAALRLAAAFAVANLLLTFALTLWSSHLGYSYFRDEFYYLACGRHLAWGYVDHGPIVALQARLAEMLFGESIFGIRVLSACAGAAMVFLGGMICWALGGHRPAQALAMLGLMLTPQYIGVDGFLSMNSFEASFWSACVLAVIMILRGSSPARWWTIFGIVAGIGLLNKPSMTFFLIALGLGLLVTPQRRILFTRWAALAIALMLLIALPNVLWQIHNHWPTLEFLQSGRLHHKNIILGPVPFFLAQVSTMQPVNALLWITGVVALLRGRSIRNARWLGATMLFFYAIMFAAHAKDYYLEGIYPAFFAAGAIAWEHRFHDSERIRERKLIGFPVFTAVLIVTTLLILPMASPVLAPATWVRYTEAMHLPHDNTERSATGPLPQFYADRFGWEREVGIVKRTFDSLSPADQQRVCIFGSNYGEAGAIDFFNRKDHVGLPPALSGQNSYWSWGTHGCDPNLVIAVIDDKPGEIAKKYDSVTIVGQMADPYSMPFEHHNIYLLRGRKSSTPFDWRDERFYI